MSDDDDSGRDRPTDPSDIDAELALMAELMRGAAEPEDIAGEETILVFSEDGVEGVFTEDEVEVVAAQAGDPDAVAPTDPGVPTGWRETEAVSAKRLPPDLDLGPVPTLTPTPAGEPVSSRSPGRMSTASRAISFLATGAMVTVLVLWATGVFDVPGIREIVREQRASESADSAVQAAPLTGAEITGEGEPEPPSVVEVERGDPSLIEIPAIGVRASVTALNTLPNGELEVPTDFAQTGWWQGGPEPGEQGPAVIAGHVDSVNGPAVFFGLEELVFDDAITITRGDGSSAVFAVRSTLNVTKEEFPSNLVYGETPDAQLRLITCDGGFDEGSYTGNLIITAELIEERPPPTSGRIF